MSQLISLLFNVQKSMLLNVKQDWTLDTAELLIPVHKQFQTDL